MAITKEEQETINKAISILKEKSAKLVGWRTSTAISINGNKRKEEFHYAVVETEEEYADLSVYIAEDYEAEPKMLGEIKFYPDEEVYEEREDW